jgi:hypothetical protein
MGVANENNYANTLARFRRGYAALFALVDDFPEELRDAAGALGEWTPREILAHLIGWVNEAQKRLGEIEAGDRQNQHNELGDNFATFNAKSVEARAEQKWDETVAELHSTVDQFSLQAAEVAPDRAAGDPRYEEWLMGLWNDCIEHMGHLIKFVESAK